MTKKDIINEFDHGSNDEFTKHYAKQSLSDSSLARMRGILDCCIRWQKIKPGEVEVLNVADIACNTGELGRMWAKEGHKVYGIDINQPLLDIAKQRAAKDGLMIEYILGSATDLPWEDESMDVCVVPGLLEHVREWERCLDEFVRVLKPGGLLYLSTTNKLCPKQQEFSLPFYSWYPGFVKRYFEGLAVTTCPQIAGHAKYPAVNWFSFYQLKKYLSRKGCESYDRFDITNIDNKSIIQKKLINLIKFVPILRLIGHVITPHLILISVKNKRCETF